MRPPNLLCTRELFDRLGGFEDWLGRDVVGKPLAEDVWFGWRARRAGARIAFSERALAHHHVFRRGLGEYVGERRRLVYFPAIVAKIPELRQELLYRGVFLNSRSAAFDLAALGALAARRRPLLGLVATLPYSLLLAHGARRWGRGAPRAAAGELAADAVGALALLRGSARSRNVVL